METRISLKLKNGIPVKLTQTSKQAVNGLSTKKIYKIISDAEEKTKMSDEFFVKKSKIRTARQFFSSDPHFRKLIEDRYELVNNKRVDFDQTYEIPLSFDEVTEQPRNKVAINKALNTVEKQKSYEEIQEKIQKYVTHIHEVVIQNSFIELIAPRIAKAFVKDIIVPDNYLKIDFPQVVTLSRSVGHFHEFLSEDSRLKNAKKPDYWENRNPPKFIDIIKNKNEAYILGQLFGLTLFLGLNDGINNIDGSNFGFKIGEDGVCRLTIVDWGNPFWVGFNGLTTEETAAKNYQFFKNKGKIGSDLFAFQYSDLIGFKNCMPFNEIIFPIPPRMLISDIYNLTSSDHSELRQTEREGFFSVCDQIIRNSSEIEKMIPAIIQDTMNRFMSKTDREKILALNAVDHLNNTISIPKSGYQLAKILKARAKSLENICNDLRQGKTLEKIAADRLQAIYQSQLLPSEKFISSPGEMEESKTLPLRARL